MPIVHQTTLKREHLTKHRDTLYVYGDVLEDGGDPVLQARECRGEPNAVAIPAWRDNRLEQSSLLSDDDFDTLKPIIQERFRSLGMHVMGGGTVCFPNRGIGYGTGGGLRQHAPRIDAFITKCYRHLMTMDIKANNSRVIGAPGIQ
jgi:hypothetical protein